MCWQVGGRYQPSHGTLQYEALLCFFQAACTAPKAPSLPRYPSDAASTRAASPLPSAVRGAAAHEASERPAAALQTNLIAGSSHAEESREWFYFPAAGAGGGQAQQDGRVGPVTKAEIRQLHR
jgi:hypothetical protein